MSNSNEGLSKAMHVLNVMKAIAPEELKELQAIITENEDWNLKAQLWNFFEAILYSHQADDQSSREGYCYAYNQLTKIVDFLWLFFSEDITKV
jgi:hypothetical protein